MSYPTLTNIYDQARAECGDTEVAGGQIYTNTILLPHIQAAVRALWKAFRNTGAKRVLKTLYYTLPANTAVLSPVAVASDFSAVAPGIGERGGLTSVAISGAVQAATGLQITTGSSHGFSTGDVIVIEQVGGLVGANILASIAVSSSTVFIANGVVVTGSYTSGGYAVKSTNQFAYVPLVGTQPSASLQSSTAITAAFFDGQYIRFTPSTQNRQLRIPYYSSAEVPTTGSDQILIDDCIDFLAACAAWKACAAMGAPVRAAELKERAVGNEYDKGINGGELRRLIVSHVRAMQALPPNERGPAPFREQNNNFSPY